MRSRKTTNDTSAGLLSGVQIMVFYSDSPVASGTGATGETVDPADGAVQPTATTAANNTEAEDFAFMCQGEFRGDILR